MVKYVLTDNTNERKIILNLRTIQPFTVEKRPFMKNKLLIINILLVFIVLSSNIPAFAEENVVELKKQIEELKNRVEELESTKTRPVVGISRTSYNPANSGAIDPFADMERIQEEMDRVFQKSFSFPNQPGQGMLTSTMSFDTNLDLKETEEGYVITFNMAGLDKDKVDVLINEHSITVKGEQTLQTQQQNPNGYFQSQSFGSFMKTVPLPEDADVTKLKTEKTDDKLVITMSKKARKN